MMTRFTFRQIEAFYWCAMLGTVHAAAQHLHISQPAVSTRIKELEEALQLTLFLRSHQRIELTPAGRRALAFAERTLRAGQELQQLGGHTTPLQGVLRFGADETAATVIATEFLHQVKRLHPELKVELSIETSKVLCDRLARREIDVAVHGTALQRPHVVDELIGRVRVAWVAAVGFDAGTAPLTPAQAATLPIVANSPPSLLHRLVKDWLHVSGYEFSHFSACNSIALMIRLVQAGHSIAALPMPVLQEPLRSGALRIVEADPPMPTMAYYVSHLEDKSGTGIGEIVALAKSILQAQGFIDEAAMAA